MARLHSHPDRFGNRALKENRFGKAGAGARAPPIDRYFGLVKIAPFGSSTILRVAAGADM